ncbi:hypothetical protein A1O7_01981 [Cladophialophora yegresii CBS 114405]|uniref:Xylanolytic transcriptional activator regulatory domain-containing protein n=1 Tax=Cladophialophora yegresii CBS 114405 TaxID=1182544 RepID=W9W0T6_9EURO|nr:uncharacterized protein A1O7_01981 [Cladophialophora yegresii CBS 114405]EXJ61553.1 hypothetical protein A1O7_01981 [Cladophialophora yegresii CBS 114405]
MTVNPTNHPPIFSSPYNDGRTETALLHNSGMFQRTPGVFCMHTRRRCMSLQWKDNSFTPNSKRLQDLEALFARLHPGLDLETALSLGPERVKTEATAVVQPTPAPQNDLSYANEDNLGLVSDLAPNEIKDYDWTEDTTSLDDIADGMAALRIEPNGAGYIGATSGVVFLRSLLYWVGNPAILTRSHLRPPEMSGQSPESLDGSWRFSEASLSQQIKTKLVDSYFANYHVSYPFVHEATFRAQYYELIPRPQQSSWNMLFYTILALGSWTSVHDRTELDDQLYQRATSLAKDESMFESANLTIVQALVLLSNLSQKRNRPNTGWNFLGLATRMGLSLGLHCEHPSWNVPVLQQEMRRRVWWGLFMFDSGASTTFGRVILLPDRSTMNAKYVLNIDDELLTARTAIAPSESPHPTIYSSMKAQADFHVQSNYISNRLLLNRSISAEEALGMVASLDQWATTLPWYFQIQEEVSYFEEWYLFARSRLWWRFWNLKIILLRQLLLRQAVNFGGQSPYSTAASNEDKCITACLEAAHLTINSINDYLHDAEVGKLAGWYSTYFLFHAALVTMIPVLGNIKSASLEMWRADIDIARNILRNILAKNPSAIQCAEILDRLDQRNNLGELSTNPEVPAPWTTGLFAWPTESDEVFDSFCWDQIGQDF